MHTMRVLSQIMTYTQQGLCFPSGLCPSGFPISTSPLHYTFPANFILLDLITWIKFCEECGSYSSLCDLLQSFITSFILGTHSFLGTLFLNSFSLYSCLCVRDHVSHPHKTTCKKKLPCISLSVFLENKHDDKKFWTKWYQVFWVQSYLNFIMNAVLILRPVLKYLDFATLQNDVLPIFML